MLLNSSLERLTDYLDDLTTKETEMDDLAYEAPADQPTLMMTRTFDAPRRLVWKALSEPEHVVRWFGPHSHTNRAVTFDFREGGKWRIESTTPEGEMIGFFGEFREIAAPEKLTQTFAFDALPEGVYSLDTVVLEERDGKTVYRGTSIFQEISMRDGMIASGMDTGVREGFARLDEMLEDFKQQA